ncbi:LysR family transcriptional regulator [Pseudomonas aeruginosa]|uniref:LysR family transcriptional regulator n=1 Tax=Pseudomonas aeruginosa TaxID=287 RepID=UPI00053E14D2|nr:LysR family transcriptional regulator [Pseudomonas aeruginosa]KSF96343.1 LysR family transcriptional regulator [Pseudomonas aeruginosa]MBH4106393.1 LysR family transcriptional regulator [Pseudomonas aeruginosa]MBN5041200.1 LysR family transcriptional regulator [Stenotrophomonas maltophilia]
MSRQNINRAFEMEVFVAVVAAEGFTAAAEPLGMTASAVSKLIGRMEVRLGVKLMHRTTRKLLLTPEGTVFHERCLRILDDIDCAEHEAARADAPRGRVRINSQVAFGIHYLQPHLREFLERYPNVQLDVVLSDTVVDLLDDRSDVAIRTGPLPDSLLTQRRLGTSDVVVVASPDYLGRAGTPVHPEDLRRHQCLGLNYARHLDAWPFIDRDGVRTSIAPSGQLRMGDGESLRQMALAGLGVARLARYHVGADLAAGRLMPLLEDWNPGDVEDIHAVFVGPGRHMPARVRVLLDFLVEQVAQDLT